MLGQRERYVEAVQALSRLIEIAPQSARELTASWARRTRHSSALTRLRPRFVAQLRLAPTTPRRIRAWAKCWPIRASWTRPSLATVRRCVSRETMPRPTTAWSPCFSEQKKFAEASESFRHVLRYDPVHLDALTNLGSALSFLGHYDEAEACHRRAIEIDPSFAEAYNNLGILLEERGERANRLDEAVAYYDRAIAIRPDYAELVCIAAWSACCKVDWLKPGPITKVVFIARNRPSRTSRRHVGRARRCPGGPSCWPTNRGMAIRSSSCVMRRGQDSLQSGRDAKRDRDGAAIGHLRRSG